MAASDDGATLFAADTGAERARALTAANAKASFLIEFSSVVAHPLDGASGQMPIRLNGSLPQ
jgi:hypothetical protein